MDKCYKHENKDAIRKCVKCGVGICELCIEVEDGLILCKECLKSEKKSSEINLVFDIDEKEGFDFTHAFDDIKNDFNITKDGLDLEDMKVEHKQVNFNIEDEIEKRVRELSYDKEKKDKSNSQKNSEFKEEKSHKKSYNDSWKREKENLKREKENLKREIEREKENLKREIEREKENLKREFSKEKGKKHSKMHNDERKKEYGEHRKGKVFSSFLVFCFSLIPGAGHMYLEFMNRGMFLCITFFGSCLLFTNAFVPISIFLFAFFDAHKYKNKLLRGENVEDTLDDIIDMFKNPVFLVIFLAILLLGGPLTTFLTSRFGLAILIILVCRLASKSRK